MLGMLQVLNETIYIERLAQCLVSSREMVLFIIIMITAFRCFKDCHMETTNLSVLFHQAEQVTQMQGRQSQAGWEEECFYNQSHPSLEEAALCARRSLSLEVPKKLSGGSLHWTQSCTLRALSNSVLWDPLGCSETVH